VAEAKRILKLAEGLANSQRDAASINLYGLALHRAGRDEDALLILQESIRVHGKGGYADTWLYLGMAQQRLGQREKAQGSLARYESLLRDRVFDTWQETTRWRLLHQEAVKQILSMPRAPKEDEQQQ
jgi:hypothetical protein